MAREPAVAVNAMVPVSLPEAGPRVSHEAVEAACQFNVPPPMFVTVRVCVVGLLFPCRALKEKLGELTPIAGFGGAASSFSLGISDVSLPAANADCINGIIGSQANKNELIPAERNNNR